MSLSAKLGLAYLLSEIVLAATRRSLVGGVKHDRGTIRVLWIAIGGSVTAGVHLATHFAPTALTPSRGLDGTGIALFAIGVFVRWWAIITLGRFFTVHVQVAPDHELVESGPFGLLRHPSYAGAILAFIGFGLTLRNWLSVIVIVLPIFAAFVQRMKVEEQALLSGLGEKYRAYMERTKRVIPYLY